MQVSIYYSLIAAIIGLLFYFLASNAKLAEVGRITFAAGIFAFCLQLGHQVANL